MMALPLKATPRRPMPMPMLPPLLRERRPWTPRSPPPLLPREVTHPLRWTPPSKRCQYTIYIHTYTISVIFFFLLPGTTNDNNDKKETKICTILLKTAPNLTSIFLPVLSLLCIILYLTSAHSCLQCDGETGFEYLPVLEAHTHADKALRDSLLGCPCCLRVVS